MNPPQDIGATRLNDGSTVDSLVRKRDELIRLRDSSNGGGPAPFVDSRGNKIVGLDRQVNIARQQSQRDLSSQIHDISKPIDELINYPYKVTGTVCSSKINVIAIVGAGSKKVLGNAKRGDSIRVIGTVDNISLHDVFLMYCQCDSVISPTTASAPVASQPANNAKVIVPLMLKGR